MSEQSGAAGHPPKSGFYQAASFVERALSFRGNTQRAASSSSIPSNDPASSTSRHQPTTKPAIAGPISVKDVKDSAESFPTVSESHIEALLPGDDLDQARQWIRAALSEMHLNYDLDPKLLGERSDVNRGSALIALLLSRIAVSKSGSQLDERGEGHLSGAVVDQDLASQSSPSASSTTQSKSTILAPHRAYETHDLLKAIDKRDVETILAIRNANFDLLLDLSHSASSTKTSTASSAGASNTPLGYAISLGKGWEGVSIVLVGALSKFVNQLPDDEDEFEPASSSSAKVKKPKKLQLDPRTMQRLRKIRVNLKLAIDHSISQDQTALLASYLQVLVMSEGSPFLESAIEDVAHCLKSRSEGGADPVARARSQVMQFVTDSLRHKSDKVASVKDYIANAQGDLVLMALWRLVKLGKGQVEGDGEVQDLANDLPGFFFARDDRVASNYVARVARLGHVAEKSAPAGLVKLASRVAEALQEGARRKSSYERLEIITAVLEGKRTSIHT